jgi:anion-transporting  ArsA/GET3 family ATPase
LFGILTQLSGDELPTLPGFDLLFGLEYLVQQAAPEYDMVVVDAGQHDALLRALSVPDGFRWLLRLIFGLDRGPGRSTESLNNAIISANLLPFEWIGRIQDVRVTLEKLRDDMVGPPRTTARYVLRPDSAALNEARLALPTLQLHGLAVDSVIAGPIMPADVSDTMLRAIAHQQQEIVNESKTIWKSLPMFHLPMTVPVTGMDELVALGKELYGDRSPTETYDVSPPIEINNDERFIAFRLPGLNRGALNLTLTYDELVVRAGPYRRHILLPDWLRGNNKIKATREGDTLFVRPRREEG